MMLKHSNANLPFLHGAYRQKVPDSLLHQRKPLRSTAPISVLACIHLLASGTPGTVWAQEAVESSPVSQAFALPEITVTTDKVDQFLDKVPASVVVIDGAELEQSGVIRLEQLEGRIPGLAFQPFGQAGVSAPAMRGLTTASINSLSTSTLLLIDGAPTLTAQGFDYSLLDVESLEVVRGPQSTLYGRNAEAGVISVKSRPIDGPARSSVSVAAGTRQLLGAQLSLNRPIVENTLYGSIAGNWLSQQGFIENVRTGDKADNRQLQNLHLGLHWTPTDSTDVTLRYAYSQFDDGAALWGSASAPRATVASGSPSWNRSSGQILSLNAQHAFESGLKLASVTAWNAFNDHIAQDTDFLPPDLMRVGRNNQLRTLSQELRLSGTAGASDWLVGVYGDWGNNELQTVTKNRRGLANARANQKSSTAAIFSNWNIPLSEKWTMSAGARVEHINVKFSPVGSTTKSQDWTSFLPRVALQYQYHPENQWYASASKGLRTGGFNILSPAMNYPSYGAEKVWSYETGLKGKLFDQRLRYSLAAYYMTITDMQVMQMPTPGVVFISSAASATSKGIELDMDYLLARNWQLIAGVAWNRTRFDQFSNGSANYAGRRNPFAPDLTGHIGLRYQNPQGWYVQASVRGSGMVYLDPANRYKRNGFAVVDLAAGYRQDNWELALYLNNATNRQYDAVGYVNGYVSVYSQPREVALRLTWKI